MPSTSSGMVGSIGEGFIGLVLYNHLARHICQTLGAVFTNADALGDLETPVFHPQARHEVESHVFLQYRCVTGAQVTWCVRPSQAGS